MKVREGLVPTILGTVVTTAGISMMRSKSKIASGVTGFGLAHVVLGGIDLLTHKK